MQNKFNNKGITTHLKRGFSLIFWIAVWHILAVYVGEKILLPTPLMVLSSLKNLIFTNTFISSVFHTIANILTGFVLALICGVVLAFFSGASSFLKTLLAPFMSVMKSVPVASFVILALLWLDSEHLSTFVAFVMVLPVIYINVLNGIYACDEKAIEMAKVYRLSRIKKILYIYLPYVIPFFKSGCAIALGLCWKAGVAAELIGVPVNSIGEQLYFSKIYFNTADLFAWTIVIILISVIFEKMFMLVLSGLIQLYERI